MLNRRAWVFPSVALGVLGGGIICWVGLVTCFRQPSYVGKPVQYWLDQLPLAEIWLGWPAKKIVVLRSVNFAKANAKPSAVARDGSLRARPEAATQAVCAIGTNGIGFYMRRLRGRSPPILHGIQQLALRCGVNPSLFRDVETERQQAATALILLKPLPPSTATELLQLSKESNRAVANAAWCVLEADWTDQRTVFGQSSQRFFIVLNGRSARDPLEHYREHTIRDSNIWSTNFLLAPAP
jgi:hypothetical protein